MAPVATPDRSAPLAHGIDFSDAIAHEAEMATFELVPCLLTEERLIQKCEEQFSIIWNGMNRVMK